MLTYRVCVHLIHKDYSLHVQVRGSRLASRLESSQTFTCLVFGRQNVRLYSYRKDPHDPLKISFSHLTTIPTGHGQTVRSIGWTSSGKNVGDRILRRQHRHIAETRGTGRRHRSIRAWRMGMYRIVRGTRNGMQERRLLGDRNVACNV